MSVREMTPEARHRFAYVLVASGFVSVFAVALLLGMTAA